MKFFVMMALVAGSVALVAMSLLPHAVRAQVPPSGWVIAIGDLQAWYSSSEVEYEFSKLGPTTGSIIALQSANYAPGTGRADIDNRVKVFIHLVCNKQLEYCQKTMTDLQLRFAQPLPFGQPAPNPVSPTTAPIMPAPTVTPFGQPNPGQ